MEKENFKSEYIDFIKNNMTRYDYDQNLCFLLCYQMLVIKNCGCFNVVFPNVVNGIRSCQTDKDYECDHYQYFEIFLKSDLVKEYSNVCPLGKN